MSVYETWQEMWRSNIRNSPILIHEQSHFSQWQLFTCKIFEMFWSQKDMKCHQGQVVSENHGHDNENINTINDYHTGYDNI